MNHENSSEVSYKKTKLHAFTQVAVMTAVTCVLSPLSVPIGPIPISLTNLVLYLTLYLLGWKLATISCLTYIAIGTIGVPIFSGFSGGIGKLMGPTGGYIIGFIPMLILSGLIIDKCSNRGLQFLGLIFGTVLCYAIGTAWFCFVAKSTLGAALGICVFPFIPGDVAKIVLVMIFAPMIRKRLVQARLLQA